MKAVKLNDRPAYNYWIESAQEIEAFNLALFHDKGKTPYNVVGTDLLYGFMEYYLTINSITTSNKPLWHEILLI